MHSLASQEWFNSLAKTNSNGTGNSNNTVKAQQLLESYSSRLRGQETAILNGDDSSLTRRKDRLRQRRQRRLSSNSYSGESSSLLTQSYNESLVSDNANNGSALDLNMEAEDRQRYHERRQSGGVT